MGLQIFRHIKEKDDGHYNMDVLLRDLKIPLLKRIYPRSIMDEIFLDTEASPQMSMNRYLKIEKPFLTENEMEIE